MRPNTPYVDWKWYWKDDAETHFFIHHLITDEGHRNRGHGSRALVNIIEWALTEKEAEDISIQMGGGASSARWLEEVGKSIEYAIIVTDVHGYEDDDWKDPDAERVDGEIDTEGDENSTVFAEVDVGLLRDYYQLDSGGSLTDVPQR
jgi:hypothetical protein